jgi:hypothetical protein
VSGQPYIAGFGRPETGASQLSEVLSVNGLVQSRRRHFFLLLAPFLLGSVVLPAGRSDAEEKTGGSKVSATTVVEALKTIRTAGGEIAEYAATDKAKAENEAEAIAPLWRMIEGTIKANDQNSYTSFEHAIEELEAAVMAGDAKKAGGAAGALDAAVQFYVAKFPAAGAPTAGEPRDAAAAPKQATAPKESAAGDRTSAAAGERNAAAESAPAAQAGDATLARTGPSSALAAVAGAAFGLGGLALIGGARRRRAAPAA